MAVFVLIGGGENGRIGTKYETKEIDDAVYKLSGKEKPDFLFLAHAVDDEDSYFEIMKKNYKNCNCDILKKKYLYEKNITKEKLDNADIIYIGGGNTLKMITLWKESGFDKILSSYKNSSKVICGISAGAMCWFKFGLSDSKKISCESDEYILLSGMNIINYLFCPSFTSEKDDYLKQFIRETNTSSLALETCTALIIKDDVYKAIRSDKSKKIYKCFYENNEYTREELNFDEEYKLMKNI